MPVDQSKAKSSDDTNPNLLKNKNLKSIKSNRSTGKSIAKPTSITKPNIKTNKYNNNTIIKKNGIKMVRPYNKPKNIKSFSKPNIKSISKSTNIKSISKPTNIKSISKPNIKSSISVPKTTITKTTITTTKPSAINITKPIQTDTNRKMMVKQLFGKGGLEAKASESECKPILTTEDKFKPINVKQLHLETAVRKQDVITNSSPSPEYQQLRTNRPPVCYYSKQGPRDSMEDTFQIMHFAIGKIPGTFYGVFDGHGGKDVSYELVHMTRGIFPYIIQSMEKNEVDKKNVNIPQLIKQCYLEYDKHLYEKNFNAGSTAVVVLKFNKKLYLINLGDSRGMIFTKNKLLCVSDDHKPQKTKERNRIYRAGHFVNPFSIYQSKNARKRFNMGDVHIDASNQQYYMYLNNVWEPITTTQYNQVKGMNVDVDTFRVSNSLALSRAFGDFYLKVDHNGQWIGEDAAVSMVPDISEIDLNKYKGQDIYIFMASDGFWDVNRNTLTLRSGLSSHPTPQQLCQELVDDALNKGSTDNTTIVYDKITN